MAVCICGAFAIAVVRAVVTIAVVLGPHAVVDRGVVDSIVLAALGVAARRGGGQSHLEFDWLCLVVLSCSQWALH